MVRRILRRALTFFLLFGFSACLPKGCGTETSSEITPARLKSEVEAFVAATAPNRSVGSKGHAAAEDYLRDRLEKIAKLSKHPTIGATFRVHAFKPDVDFAADNYRADFENLVKKRYQPGDAEYVRWERFTRQAVKFVEGYRGKEGRNLVVEIPGHKTPSEFVTVLAHYDTITHDHATMEFTPDGPAPGADDNASAIAALLIVGEEIARGEPGKSVRIVAVDYEEIFFLGSLALARDLAAARSGPGGKTELGAFALEMLGHSSGTLKNLPVVKLYTRDPAEGAAAGAAQDIVLAKAFDNAAVEGRFKITPKILSNGFNRSDNWSFWQAGIPAIAVSQDWEGDFNEKLYHSAADTPDTLNYEYLAEITKTLVRAVKQVAR